MAHDGVAPLGLRLDDTPRKLVAAATQQAATSTPRNLDTPRRLAAALDTPRRLAASALGLETPRAINHTDIRIAVAQHTDRRCRVVFLITLSLCIGYTPAVWCLTMYYSNAHLYCYTQVDLWLGLTGWLAVTGETLNAINLPYELKRVDERMAEEKARVREIRAGREPPPPGQPEPETTSERWLRRVLTTASFASITSWIVLQYQVWSTEVCPSSFADATRASTQGVARCCSSDLWHGARSYLLYTYIAFGVLLSLPCLCLPCLCVAAARIVRDEAARAAEEPLPPQQPTAQPQEDGGACDGSRRQTGGLVGLQVGLDTGLDADLES